MLLPLTPARFAGSADVVRVLMIGACGIAICCFHQVVLVWLSASLAGTVWKIKQEILLRGCAQHL